jgi:hypothetical protein
MEKEKNRPREKIKIGKDPYSTFHWPPLDCQILTSMRASDENSDTMKDDHDDDASCAGFKDKEDPSQLKKQEVDEEKSVILDVAA